jgi:hypothetical protein
MTLTVQNWKEAGWRHDVVELRHLSSGCHSLPPAGKSLPLPVTHFHFYTSCIYSFFATSAAHSSASAAAFDLASSFSIHFLLA